MDHALAVDEVKSPSRERRREDRRLDDVQGPISPEYFRAASTASLRSTPTKLALAPPRLWSVMPLIPIPISRTILSRTGRRSMLSVISIHSHILYRLRLQ